MTTQLKELAAKVNKSTLAVWLRLSQYTNRYFSTYEGKHRVPAFKV